MSHGFNPRAPCGARLLAFFGGPARRMFQSTRPVRGATYVQTNESDDRDVSIHAPRAGRDVASVGFFLSAVGVSIHAPRAGRDSANASR